MNKKILTVEDEAIIAIEIKSTLKILGYTVAGHATTAQKAIDLIETDRPDLILLDIHLKGDQNGIELAKVINEKYKIPFVFLTSYSDGMILEEAIKVLPYGYIVKPFTTNDIKSAIEIALYKFEVNKPFTEDRTNKIRKKTNNQLSDRDYEILDLMIEGLPYKMLAQQLEISVNTVKTYQKRLFQYFEVNSRNELVSKVLKL